MEERKKIIGFEDYEVTSEGKIYNVKTGNEVKQSGNGGDYKNVSIGGKTIQVHRLVAIHFISNLENKPCVNHKDLNKSNNNVENLEWVTHQENTEHMLKYSDRTIHLPNQYDGFKTGANLCKLTYEDVVKIKQLIFFDNMSHSRIAKMFNVSRPAISFIKEGKRWAEVPLIKPIDQEDVKN